MCAGDADALAAAYVEVGCTAVSQSREYLAAGDEYGRVRIFRFPAAARGARSIELTGHACGVSNAAWCAGDTRLVTIGSRDRALFQWRVDAAVEGQYGVAAARGGARGGAGVAEIEVDEREDEEVLPRRRREPWAEAVVGGNAAAAFQYELDYAAALVAAATAPAHASSEKLTSASAWRGSLPAPTTPPRASSDAPRERLELEWVHGYRAQDQRGSARYTARGDVVYPAGALGVVLRRELGDERGIQVWISRICVAKCVLFVRAQMFHAEHTDEISCLAVHPRGHMVATGCMGTAARIIVWRADDQRTVRVLTGHSVGVAHAAFASRGPPRLASVGLDEGHVILIHDWAGGGLLARVVSGDAGVFALSWAPDDAVLSVAGTNFVSFYDVTGGGGGLAKRAGAFGAVAPPQLMTAIGWCGGDAVVGAADGQLYRFASHYLDRTYAGHSAGVTAIVTARDSIATGGKDGGIKIWSSAMECVKTFNIASLGCCLIPSVRSLAWAQDSHRFLIGTAASELIEVNSITGAALARAPIVSGHFLGGLYGLAAHPMRAEYATVGDDATLRVWDAGARSMKAVTEFDAPARAVAYVRCPRLLVPHDRSCA